jgi:uncharacterized lipoprotein
MNGKTLMNSTARAALVLAIAAGLGACSWFRGNSDYERSPESRPLAVPPDLDAPMQDPALAIPSPAPATATARAAAPTPSAAFSIADSGESAWRRLGLALQRIEGVEVLQAAQSLNAYNVRYQGEEFLVRVVASGDSSRIEAVGANGAVVNVGAAGNLLGQLRARLG